MKLRCITILENKLIPILDEVTIRNNVLYLNENKYSTLNGFEISLNNVELKILNLENNIYSISLNEECLPEFNKNTRWYEISPVYKNIKLNGIQLWGDVVILKIIKDKVLELTINEVDKYIELIKNNKI